jgi:hypothetical protein
MARREVRRHGQPPHGKRLAIRHGPHLVHTRIHGGLSRGVLGIVGARAAAFERTSAGAARRHRCTAETLEGGNAARVVVMGVRVHDEANGLGAESERPDVLVDQCRRLRQPAVEQDAPCVGCDQDGRESCYADIIRVAEHAKRSPRHVPLRAGLTRDWCLRLQRRGLLSGGHQGARGKGEQAVRAHQATLSVRLHVITRSGPRPEPEAGWVPGQNGPGA